MMKLNMTSLFLRLKVSKAFCWSLLLNLIKISLVIDLIFLFKLTNDVDS